MQQSQQELKDYTDNLQNCYALDQCSPGGVKVKGYLGCASSGLSDKVKIATQVIVGAGTAAMGVFGLLGAEAIALALPAAALFNAAVMSIGIQIDVAAALKNVNNSCTYNAMYQAVVDTESMLGDFMIGLVIPEAVGQIKDIYTGSVSFIQAFENTDTLTIPPPTDTYIGSFSGMGTETWSCMQWNDNISATITITVSGCEGSDGDSSMKLEGFIGGPLVYCYCEDCPYNDYGPYAFDGAGDTYTVFNNTVENRAEGKVISAKGGIINFIAGIFGGTIKGNTLTGTFYFSTEDEDWNVEKTITLTK